jgi:hypothetical protein
MSSEDDAILFYRPGRLVDVWVQVVVPSFATLFTDATCE